MYRCNMARFMAMVWPDKRHEMLFPLLLQQAASAKTKKAILRRIDGSLFFLWLLVMPYLYPLKDWALHCRTAHRPAAPILGQWPYFFFSSLTSTIRPMAVMAFIQLPLTQYFLFLFLKTKKNSVLHLISYHCDANVSRNCSFKFIQIVYLFLFSFFLCFVFIPH